MNVKVLGYIFKELRCQSGLTLRQVAERVDMDYSYLSKIETGVSEIQRHQFVALTHFYGVTKETIYRKCETFFGDLREVLEANLMHKDNREQISNAFLKKYDDLKISRYLPYLHFVELENLSYMEKRNDRFFYLIDALKPEYFISPYNFFLITRNLYWKCQTHNEQGIKEYLPIVEKMMKTLDKKYHPYGYYYLLSGYILSGDNVRITRLYDLAHSGFIELENLHFAMLSETMYAGYLVLHREYKYSISVHKKLLTNKAYQFSKYAQKSINFNIAEAYLQIEDIPNALKYYNISMDIVPQKSTAFFICYCLFRLNKIEEAISFTKQALSIGVKNPFFSDLLVWIKRYLAMGRREKHIVQLEELEEKYATMMDDCLCVTLLKIKIDHYRVIGDLAKENHYLRMLVAKLQNT